MLSIASLDGAERWKLYRNDRAGEIATLAASSTLLLASQSDRALPDAPPDQVKAPDRRMRPEKAA